MRKLQNKKVYSSLAHSAHIVLMIFLIAMIKMFNQKSETRNTTFHLKGNEILSSFYNSP